MAATTVKTIKNRFPQKRLVISPTLSLKSPLRAGVLRPDEVGVLWASLIGTDPHTVAVHNRAVLKASLCG